MLDAVRPIKFLQFLEGVDFDNVARVALAYSNGVALGASIERYIVPENLLCLFGGAEHVGNVLGQASSVGGIPVGCPHHLPAGPAASFRDALDDIAFVYREAPIVSLLYGKCQVVRTILVFLDEGWVREQ